MASLSQRCRHIDAWPSQAIHNWQHFDLPKTYNSISPPHPAPNRLSRIMSTHILSDLLPRPHPTRNNPTMNPSAHLPALPSSIYLNKCQLAYHKSSRPILYRSPLTYNQPYLIWKSLFCQGILYSRSKMSAKIRSNYWINDILL